MGVGAVLEQLIGPPGGFIFLIFFGLLVMRRHRRAGLYLVVSGSALLYVASLSVTAHVLTSWLEPATAVSENNLMMENNPPQAIVILGAGRRYDAPEFAGDTLNAFALERVRYGVWLSRRTLLPILVTGGLGDEKILPEATIMKQVIEYEYALPVRWVEKESHTTYENALYSAKILQAQNINSIYLVTHALHMKRSVASFEKFGLIVTPAPTAFNGASKRSLTLRSFLPSAKSLSRVALVFHEWVGIIWYSLRY